MLRNDSRPHSLRRAWPQSRHPSPRTSFCSGSSRRASPPARRPRTSRPLRKWACASPTSPASTASRWWTASRASSTAGRRTPISS
ncbi:MAG: hypothetical protein E6J66_10745 [Deltaproteobacteria bacterium]|nr:MAG: hypothetical protein E6J66_10745 [Deltaproteobacteria bacterium]